MSKSQYSRRGPRARTVIGSLASLAVASPVFANALSSVIFRAEAISVAGDGVVEISFDQGEFDPGSGSYHYSLQEPVSVTSEATGEVVATLNWVELSLTTGFMNSIDLSFGVTAGIATTTFVIESPIIRHRSVPANEARARASAWLTISDLDDNFAMLQGLGPPGSGAYASYYNVDDQGDGTQFDNLVGFLFAGAGATVSGGQLDPPTGYRSISNVVDSSSSVIAFVMSANDDAYATTLFMVPGRSHECVGDADADWDIDLADLATVLQCFGTTDASPLYSLDADLNMDGAVDLADLTILLSVFGNSCQ
jgi:hypothetical protein